MEDKKQLINPQLKNMLIMMLAQQTMDAVKESGIKTDLGNLEELLFILSPEKEVQQIRWSKKTYNPKTDEVEVGKEQIGEFCMLVSVDQETMYEGVKSYFIKIDLKKQIIFFTKNNSDGSKLNETL